MNKAFAPAFLILTLPWCLAQAATYYVSPSGNDSNPGTLASPFRTINKAHNIAAAGDTVLLRGGIYKPTQLLVTRGGSSGAPITYAAYQNENPILDGTGAAIAFTDGVIKLNQVNYVTIDGFEIVNSPGRGITYTRCANLVIRNCKIHEIQSRGLGGSGDNILMEGNEIWRTVMENENNAYLASGASGGWFQAVGTGGWADGTATTPSHPSTNVMIRNNYVHDNWGEGICPLFLDSATVQGNIIKDCYSCLIYQSSSRNVKIDGNYLYTTNSAFYRTDKNFPATGISMATESSDLSPLPPQLMMENGVISNNIIVSAGKAINYWHDSSNTGSWNTYRNIKISNNVIKDAWRSPIDFDAVGAGFAAPYGCAVQNNIIYKAKDGSTISLGEPGAWTYASNDWPNGVPSSVADSKSFASDPRFVDPAAGAPDGFKLQSASPCIGKGTPLATVKTDFWGTLRSTTTPTIGSYEPAAGSPASSLATPRNLRSR